jgi:hypothetical protein
LGKGDPVNDIAQPAKHIVDRSISISAADPYQWGNDASIQLQIGN